jgi:hypothetical protein
MMIERDLIINQVMPDTLDILPSGQVCDVMHPEYHEFFLETKAASFTYKICGRCGAVRIGERRS